MKITPESALGFLNDAAIKHLGTRDDHKVLEASAMLLKQVVAEWQMYKDEAEAAAKIENLEVVPEEVVNDE